MNELPSLRNLPPRDRGREPLLVMVEALYGCRVYYEIGVYAFVMAPDGAYFRARVGTAEVPLWIVPPVVDLELIAARRKPMSILELIRI